MVENTILSHWLRRTFQNNSSSHILFKRNDFRVIQLN